MFQGSCECSFGLCLKKPLLLFSANPVGGGIPHGVFPEMGPRGNIGPLTEHRPRWTGTHDTVQFSPDTKQTCIKAQTDTEARKGPGAASSGRAKPHPTESKSKGCKSGGSCCTPDLAEASESVSDSVSGSLTDIAAHLEPGAAEAQGQVLETLTEPETTQARKSPVGASAKQESARPGKQSAGEHWAETANLSTPVCKTSTGDPASLSFNAAFMVF